VGNFPTDKSLFLTRFGIGYLILFLLSCMVNERRNLPCKRISWDYNVQVSIDDWGEAIRYTPLVAFIINIMMVCSSMISDMVLTGGDMGASGIAAFEPLQGRGRAEIGGFTHCLSLRKYDRPVLAEN